MIVEINMLYLFAGLIGFCLGNIFQIIVQKF